FLVLSSVLTRPINNQDLYLYLVVSKYSISNSPRRREIAKPHILHQQDVARCGIPISSDKKTRPHPRHLGQKTMPLFSCPYRCHPNQPPHLTALVRCIKYDLSCDKFDPSGAIKT
ncbi:hypothetical protein CR513_62502, partial [Mucuna pruriens]